MSRFRKSERREVPSLNTASLPDLIFTLLFFFMIATNMRHETVRLQFKIPTATELQKLEKKSLVTHLYVGKDQRIQIDNQVMELVDVYNYLLQKKENIEPENRENMIVSLKIDKNTKMGLVNDIKKNLRKAGLLTIHFATEKRDSNDYKK